MAQFEFIAWLAKWLFQQVDFEFDWDHGNSTKSIRKHGVKVESAEQVFRNKECLVPLGIQISPVADEPRFGALGWTWPAINYRFASPSDPARSG